MSRFSFKELVPSTRAGLKAFSLRLILSYLIDWVTLVVIAAIAGGLSAVTPHFRNFSLVDLSISFPRRNETISTVALAFIAGVIPAVIIFLVILILVPGPGSWSGLSREVLIRTKIWEWNVAFLGFAMTHAVSQLIVQGVKNMIGKPRPNALSGCVPDLTDVSEYRVGGYGQDISPSWILVDQTICTQTDRGILNDSFRSFPSGHAATSWAGMVFLSLFLASKFAVSFPLAQTTRPRSHSNQTSATSSTAAAAPLTFVLILIIPLGVAMYVTGTRFFDYYHFGIDLLVGTLIGALSAYFSFRWYYPALGSGAGWAWGPRGTQHTFVTWPGKGGWVDDDDDDVVQKPDSSHRDIESRPAPPQQQFTNTYTNGAQNGLSRTEYPSQQLDTMAPMPQAYPQQAGTQQYTVPPGQSIMRPASPYDAHSFTAPR